MDPIGARFYASRFPRKCDDTDIAIQHLSDPMGIGFQGIDAALGLWREPVVWHLRLPPQQGREIGSRLGGGDL